MTNIKITARHLKITNEIRDNIQEKFNYLSRYFDKIKHIEIIIDYNKEQYIVETIVSVIRGKRIVSKTSDYNYLSAINTEVTKIERQLIKFKEKIKKSIHNSKKTQSSLKTESLLEKDNWY